MKKEKNMEQFHFNNAFFHGKHSIGSIFGKQCTANKSRNEIPLEDLDTMLQLGTGKT